MNIIDSNRKTITNYSSDSNTYVLPSDGYVRLVVNNSTSAYCTLYLKCNDDSFATIGTIRGSAVGSSSNSIFIKKKKE